jgi:hypothetical protein
LGLPVGQGTNCVILTVLTMLPLADETRETMTGSPPPERRSFRVEDFQVTIFDDKAERLREVIDRLPAEGGSGRDEPMLGRGDKGSECSLHQLNRDSVEKDRFPCPQWSR